MPVCVFRFSFCFLSPLLWFFLWLPEEVLALLFLLHHENGDFSILMKDILSLQASCKWPDFSSCYWLKVCLFSPASISHLLSRKTSDANQNRELCLIYWGKFSLYFWFSFVDLQFDNFVLLSDSAIFQSPSRYSLFQIWMLYSGATYDLQILLCWIHC
jgi:hypothetical protein